MQYCSDLHLEFKDNREYLLRKPLEKAADILLIAGDFFYLGIPTGEIDPFLDDLSKRWERVLVIPGNHEFYFGQDVTGNGRSWHLSLRDNVSYHYNEVVSIDDADVILSTMWSYVPPQSASAVRRGLNDFCNISYDGHRMTVPDFNREHEKCVNFIAEAVEKSTARAKVVVTHHLPSMAVVSPQHYHSTINSGFAVELGKYIEDSGIDVWVFGHSHANLDATIGKTRLLSNQLGYVAVGESTSFSRGKTFDV